LAAIECPDCKWSGDSSKMVDVRNCPNCDFDILSHISKYGRMIDQFVVEVTQRIKIHGQLKKTEEEVERKNKVIDILQSVCDDYERRIKKAQKETKKNW